MPYALRAAALTCLTATAVLLPATAHAERWDVPDPRRDVDGVQVLPEPEPCGTEVDVDTSDRTNEDVTRLRVRHTRTHVRVRARFRDLDETVQSHLVTFHLVTNERAWMLDVFRFQRKDGSPRTMSFLARTPAAPDHVDECGDSLIMVVGLSCRKGLVVDLETDTVSASLPRRCLDNPRWVRAGVESHGYLEDDAGTPTYLHDQWGEEAAPADDFLSSPLGPRLAAPRGADLREIAGPAPTSDRGIGLVGGPGYRWVRQ